MQSKSFFGRVCAVFAMTWSASTMATPPATQTRRFHLDAPPLRVMPLFTAEGERAWAKGWDPKILSSGTERGSVFRTRAHGHETTWIVIDYRPERLRR